MPTLWPPVTQRTQPFVLIRCTRYTNSKRLAETIAVYTFVASYYLARMPENRAGIPIIIGCMTDVVGEDLGNGPNTLNDRLLFENNEALFAAKTLAGLDLEDCLFLVLYYVEKLDLGEFAAITGKSIDEIMGIVGRAQRSFLASMTKGYSLGTIASVGEIRHRLDSVAEGFDKVQFERIITTVMDYLIKQT